MKVKVLKEIAPYYKVGDIMEIEESLLEASLKSGMVELSEDSGNELEELLDTKETKDETTVSSNEESGDSTDSEVNTEVPSESVISEVKKGRPKKQ